MFAYIKNFLYLCVQNAKERKKIMMTTMQMPAQQMNTVEAIWSLIQCQTKSVQKALTKRFVALDKEQALQAKLNATRQEIAAGNCITCKTQEELDNFLASL